MRPGRARPAGDRALRRRRGSKDAVAASAESLYAVGTRLFTVGVGGPHYDLGALRDLVAWRDETNEAEGAA